MKRDSVKNSKLLPVMEAVNTISLQMPRKSTEKADISKIPFTWMLVSLFLLMFAVFMFSGWFQVGSVKFEDYPFGSDVPYYLEAYLNPLQPEPFVAVHHCPTLAIMRLCHWMASVLPWGVNAVLWPKMFLAFLGALNVVIVHRLGQLLSGKNSILFSLLYGFSGSIWFFSSIPESYAITSLCVALYLYAFYRWNKPWEFSKILLMSILMAVGTLNEIAFPLVFIIPLMHHANKLKSLKVVGPWIVHLLIAAIMVVAIEGRITRNEAHSSMLTYYEKDVRHERGKVYHRNRMDYSVPQEMEETALNLSLFAVAFPSSSARHTNSLFPQYEGYFDPSLLRYFHHFLPSLAFILVIFACYRSVKAFKMIDPMLCAGLLSYVLIRMGLVFFYNPIEAFLYSAPMTLPVILLVSYGLLISPLRRDKYIFGLLVFIVFLNNLHFFQKSFA